jgi:hypothetical protein
MDGQRNRRPKDCRNGRRNRRLSGLNFSLNILTTRQLSWKHWLNNRDHKLICNIIKEYDQGTSIFSDLDTKQVKGCHVQKRLFHRIWV